MVHRVRCGELFERSQIRCFVALLIALLLTRPVPAAETSTFAPRAAHALLLDVVNTGEKLIAVGDHGNVIISKDNGASWQQSLTPTRTLLTGVSFPDAQHGWAVGHDGVIINTLDGGQTWQRQDDGSANETVYLDVLFLNAKRGFIIGAYGKFLTTNDGGLTWIARQPQADEVHYNRITAGGQGRLFLAGEAGTFLISNNSGESWQRREVPYDGSLFGALALPKNAILVYGLRGHILRSEDQGENWTPEHSAVKVLIMGGARLKNGEVVLVGQGGNFFISHDVGHTFLPWKPTGFSTSVADLVETNDGQLLTVGEAGAVKIKLP